MCLTLKSYRPFRRISGRDTQHDSPLAPSWWFLSQCRRELRLHPYYTPLSQWTLRFAHKVLCRKLLCSTLLINHTISFFEDGCSQARLGINGISSPLRATNPLTEITRLHVIDVLRAPRVIATPLLTRSYKLICLSERMASGDFTSIELRDSRGSQHILR